MGLTDVPPARAPGADGEPQRDEGAILVLTLLLTVVLSVVVLALATYSTVGLATSRVTTDRSRGNAAASAALTWVIEELAAKRLTVDECDGGTITFPSGLIDDGTATTVTCSPGAEVNDSPTVALAGRAVGGVETRIVAEIQLPGDRYEAPVLSWTVADGPAPADANSSP